MPIVPDTKDWTWVLERPCPECGFEAATFPREKLGAMIRDNAIQWPPLLHDPLVAIRPADNRWSCLEYACHVRDVFALYDRRLQMMLEHDYPLYPNWDQDAAALEGRYEAQDPIKVIEKIELTASLLAARFDGVSGDQWNRTGRRSDGAHFTVESFGRYLIHDPIHHIHDVRLGYDLIRRASRR